MDDIVLRDILDEIFEDFENLFWNFTSMGVKLFAEFWNDFVLEFALIVVELLVIVI